MMSSIFISDGVWYEEDEWGLGRRVSECGRKRRYSYDAGKTWGATPSKARDAAGILGRYEIRGLSALMTSSQAKRWNKGCQTERDLNTIEVTVGADETERTILMREMESKLRGNTATFCNY